MLNQIILVGRIKGEIVLNKEEGKQVVRINLEVSRSFVNDKGEYETDIIPVVLYNSMATSIAEYCKEKDMVGVKGNLQNNKGNLEIIAEKVTYLSSKKEERNKD